MPRALPLAKGPWAGGDRQESPKVAKGPNLLWPPISGLRDHLQPLCKGLGKAPGKEGAGGRRA